MIEFKKFSCDISTKKGDHNITVRAFNRAQAKRRIMSNYSARYDAIVIKKITPII